MVHHVRRGLPFVILVLLLAFVPLWTMKASPAWDFTGIILPWFELMSTTWHHGEIPLWNPWDFLGTPMGLAPTSQTFYPGYWIPSLLMEMSHRHLMFLHFLHYLWMGIGGYFFAARLWRNEKSGVFFGITFPLCAFFTAHTSHGWFVIAGAFIPWTLYFLSRAVDEKSAVCALLSGLCFGCGFVGGYPAITLILGTGFSIWYVLFALPRAGFRWAALCAVLVGLGTLLVASPVFAGLYCLGPEFARGKVDLGAALWGGLPLKGLLNFIFPDVAGAYDELQTSPPLLGVYVGLVTLVLAALVLMWRRKSEALLPREIHLFSVLGGLSLLAALGKKGGVRELLYRFVPGYDTFQYASIFRIFFGFCVVAIAAGWFVCFSGVRESDLAKRKKEAVFLIAALLIVLVGFTLYAVTNPGGEFWNLVKKTAPAQIAIACGLALAIFLPRSKTQIVSWVLALCVLDILLAHRTNYAFFFEQTAPVAPMTDIDSKLPANKLVDSVNDPTTWARSERAFSTWGLNPFVTRSLSEWLNGNTPAQRQAYTSAGKFFLTSQLASEPLFEGIADEEVDLSTTASGESRAAGAISATSRLIVDEALTMKLRDAPFVSHFSLARLNPPPGGRVLLKATTSEGTLVLGDYEGLQRGLLVPVGRRVSAIELESNPPAKFDLHRPILFRRLVEKGVVVEEKDRERVARFLLGSKGQSARLILTSLGLNHWRFSVEAAEPQMLVLNQLGFRGWSARIDGVGTEIITANHSFQSVLVPAGNHTVDFQFDALPVVAAFRLQAATLIVTALYLLFWMIRSGTAWVRPIGAWPRTIESKGSR